MADLFPAKILLFGEYTVLNGSQALAIPLHKWHGQWVQRETLSETDPIDYYRWLLNDDLITDTIYGHMIEDINLGWQYLADIPVGYGVGSSGAYVAALYDRYISLRYDHDFQRQTDILARMESWFHGSSSGMDPLVSYTDKALYKDQQGQFHCVQNPGWPEGYKIYLLDTGMTRHTSSLVLKYKTMLEEDAFEREVKQQFIPMVEHAIHYYLQGQGSMLENCLSVISQFQRSLFEEMIPLQVRHVWDELSLLKGVYVKLCGAGGGGYYLVIDTGNNELKPYPLISVS